MSSGRPFGSPLELMPLLPVLTFYPSGTSVAPVMVVARALSLSISWVSQSISSLMPFLQACSRFSASMTMCWYMGTRYWRSITNLGLGVSCLMLPTPRPPHASACRVDIGQLGSKSLGPISAGCSLQAASQARARMLLIPRAHRLHVGLEKLFGID